MIIWAILSACLVLTAAAPGYPLHGLGLDLYSPPLLKAPILSAPYYAPPPLLAHAPLLEHAPILAPAPIIKAAPIIKTIAPATSYATVTQFHVAHPAPIVKTIVASPPILKSYGLPYGYPGGYH